MIAVSRCLIVTGKSKILSSAKVQICICILIRIYGLLLLIPTNLKAIIILSAYKDYVVQYNLFIIVSEIWRIWFQLPMGKL